MILEPETVKERLAAILESEITCTAEGDRLRLDTPYVLQDGRMFRAYLTPAPNNAHMMVSDGGYATEQIEIFARTRAVMNDRYRELEKIAHELHLNWDTEFSFVESELDAAVKRIALLARAVDRSLNLNQPRANRMAPPLRKRLGVELKNLGLRVVSRAHIPTHQSGRPVTVDYRVQDQNAEAAVEVLTSKTERGAIMSVNQAVTNFHILRSQRYRGSMVAVYDEDSPAAAQEVLQRFSSARPEDARLIPGREAAPAIQRLMAA